MTTSTKVRVGRRKRSPTLAPLKPSLLFYIWILTHTLTATKRTIHSQTVQVGLGSGSTSTSTGSSNNASSSNSNSVMGIATINVNLEYLPTVTIPAAEAKQNIPSSKSSSFLGQIFSYPSNYDDLPPWNPSPQIDHQGFLSSTYKCIPGSWEKEAQIGGKYGHTSKHTQRLAAEEQEVYIRQVPGDGNCLFHSLAAGLSWVEDGVHLDFDENSRPPPKDKDKDKDRRGKNGNERGGFFMGMAMGPNPGGSRNEKEENWFGGGRRTKGRNGDQEEYSYEYNSYPNSNNNNHHNRRMDIYTRSAILRQRSVDMLQPRRPSPPLRSRQERKREDEGSRLAPTGGTRACRNNPNHNQRSIYQHDKGEHDRDHALFLQGSEKLKPAELLQVACSQYGMSGEEYCKQMKNDGVWGGGPEIVSLSNYLRRPIHVYELISVRPKIKKVGPKQLLHNHPHTRGKWARDLEEGINININANQNLRSGKMQPEPDPEFRLRRMACFGSPKFDDREPLHILSADCRFPDLEPGLQATAGNHFMAVFPNPRHRRHRRPGANRRNRDKSPVISLQSNVRVRSGGSDSNVVKCKGSLERTRKPITTPKMNTRAQGREEEEDNSDNTFPLLSRMMNFCTKCTEWRDETAFAAATSTTEMLSKNCGRDPLQTFKKWCNGRDDKQVS